VDRLKTLIEGLGLTPESTAARIRQDSGETLSGETIRNWLAGKNLPQVRHLHAFADAFGIDIRMFFEPQDPAAKPAKTPARGRRRAAP
jgi:transcriptional regulator with XRE-family HTH domain